MKLQTETINHLQNNIIGVPGVHTERRNWKTNEYLTPEKEKVVEYDDKHDFLEDGTYIISSALFPKSVMYTSDQDVNAHGEYSLFLSPKSSRDEISLQHCFDIRRQADDESYLISSRGHKDSAMITSTAKKNQYGDWFVYMSPEDKMCFHSGKLRFYIDLQEDGSYRISSAMIHGSAMCVSTQEGGNAEGGNNVCMSTHDQNDELPGKWRFHLERVM